MTAITGPYRTQSYLSNKNRKEREDLRVIPNEAITTPSNTLSTLLYKIDKSGIPINIKEVGIDSFKRLLLEMCIREARWIGKHPNSLKLQKVPIEEFEQTFDYGLKDITKLDDFNQVVDWENSSFYQATNQSSSVIS